MLLSFQVVSIRYLDEALEILQLYNSFDFTRERSVDTTPTECSTLNQVSKSATRAPWLAGRSKLQLKKQC